MICGVQRNADYGFIANGRQAKGFLGPALQLDVSHRLGDALGANRVRTALEGETLLRLRHATARHGEQYEHDEAAFQYCFVILRHLLLLGIHSSSGSELHSCDRSESVATTRVTGVYL